MADEEKAGEMPKEEKPVEEVKAEIAKTDTSQVEAELEKVRKALKEANKEAAERRKRLDELEAKEKERQLAEMSEVEKANAKYKEIEAAKLELEKQLKQRDWQALQNKTARAVAKELNLTFEQVEPFVDRLRGETEEELLADAKTVFALLRPITQETEKPKQPKQTVTNPAQGEKGETKAQVRARTLGTNSYIWEGGKVVMVEKE